MGWNPGERLVISGPNVPDHLAGCPGTVVNAAGGGNFVVRLDDGQSLRVSHLQMIRSLAALPVPPLPQPATAAPHPPTPPDQLLADEAARRRSSAENTIILVGLLEALVWLGTLALITAVLANSGTVDEVYDGDATFTTTQAWVFSGVFVAYGMVAAVLFRLAGHVAGHISAQAHKDMR